MGSEVTTPLLNLLNSFHIPTGVRGMQELTY